MTFNSQYVTAKHQSDIVNISKIWQV